MEAVGACTLSPYQLNVGAVWVGKRLLHTHIDKLASVASLAGITMHVTRCYSRDVAGCLDIQNETK